MFTHRDHNYNNYTQLLRTYSTVHNLYSYSILTRKLSLILSAADTCNTRCECGDGPELVLPNCRGAEAAGCFRDSNKAPRVRLFLREGWGQSPEGGGVLLLCRGEFIPVDRLSGDCEPCALSLVGELAIRRWGSDSTDLRVEGYEI